MTTPGWSVQGAVVALPVYTSTYNGTAIFKLGGVYLWVDAANRLRRSLSAPTTDLDGVAVGDPPVTNSTALLSAANSLNTTGKYQGRPVFCTTENKPHWAAGGGTTSAWLLADGTTIHTPV